MSNGVMVASIVVVLGGCILKPAEESFEPISNPQRAVSNDGTTLTAMAGKPHGFCLVRSSLRGKAKTELLTIKGALSEKQLKRELRFMGYGAHIGYSLLAVGLAGVSVAGAVPTAVGLTVMSGAGIVTRIVHSNIEGEKAKPITISAILQGLGVVAPVNLIVEFFTRKKRFRKLLSDNEDEHLTNKRMQKLMENIAKVSPDFAGGCDHVKAELKQG